MNRRVIPLLAAFVFSAAAWTDPIEYAPGELGACRAEISAVCAGVRNGGGRIVQCLRANVPKLSSPCARAVAPPGADASADASSSLTIEVRNVRSDTGVIWLTLDDDAASFPRGRHRTLVMPAATGSVTATFHGLKAGSYAFVAYHDENDNGRIDDQADGQHLEGFAYSNDVHALDAAKSMVKVSGNSTASVRLEYSLPPRSQWPAQRSP
jgi:uncharacterized protein (DUF2141 family)